MTIRQGEKTMQMITGKALEARVLLAAELATTPFEIGLVASAEIALRSGKPLSENQYRVIMQITSRHHPTKDRINKSFFDDDEDEVAPKKSKAVVEEDEDDFDEPKPKKKRKSVEEDDE
jgi:hypothetical protein